MYGIPYTTDRIVKNDPINDIASLDDAMPPVDRLCALSNLYPFMIAASYENSDISVVYRLLRQVPSFLVNCINHAGRDSMDNKQRKRNVLDNV